jgi:hypothetical protein
MAHRVRVEGRDDGRALLGPRPLDRLAHNGLMPQVKAVEIPQRQDRAVQLLREGIAMAEADQAARSSVTKA